MVSGTNLFRAVLSLTCIASLAEAYPTPWQVNYTDVNDPDFALMGYMTLPPNVAAMDDSTDDVTLESAEMLPAVVILPVRCVDAANNIPAMLLAMALSVVSNEFFILF
jgi:hypothetical protein